VNFVIHTLLQNHRYGGHQVFLAAASKEIAKASRIIAISGLKDAITQEPHP
jgi:hypothetical protein